MVAFEKFPRLHIRNKPFAPVRIYCFLPPYSLRHKYIGGRAKLEPELSGKPALCAKTPCNYIDLGIMSIKNIDLALKVRRKPKSKKVRQSKRALGAGIEDRPEAAEAREEFGHWEIDSVIGKKSGKSAVPAIVERKARSQIAADAAVGQVAGSFGEAAGGAFKSAAGDNGREFAGRGGAVERAVYFRHPCSSFEKGASERHSGLPRRFAEKGGSVGGMPAQLISKAADWNNSLPRKILGCKTPAEMFEIEILKTAQGAERRLRRHQTPRPPRLRLRRSWGLVAPAPTSSTWVKEKNPYGDCCI